MYIAKVSGTNEWLEAKNFKTLYEASLFTVMDYLKKDELHTVTIEVDGQDKYQISPMKWMCNMKPIGKSIEVTRLTDWSSLTIKAFFKEGCMI